MESLSIFYGAKLIMETIVNLPELKEEYSQILQEIHDSITIEHLYLDTEDYEVDDVLVSLLQEAYILAIRINLANVNDISLIKLENQNSLGGIVDTTHDFLIQPEKGSFLGDRKEDEINWWKISTYLLLLVVMILVIWGSNLLN